MAEELRTMELLAPAGNLAVALTALDAGADAVYCGLRKFNARERSENFTHDELSRLIAYAHKNRRKVFVTFNTLLKESELKDAAAEMAFLAECLPDAVIVQDLGVARMIREYFPQLTLHASTQLGIHNSAGLEAARRFGFRRVILERQVTLEELRQMVPEKGDPPLELELFIHGALCCCVSGSCLFSSWLGGWSGNRGKCKQPCRRRYLAEGRGESSEGEFLFSPDDLCSLELLDDFRKLGVCSLKIEGRLRRADYVEKVVRAYRLALDADRTERQNALEDARKILRGAITRKTSAGFYTQGSMKHLIRLDAFGGSGIPCGVVGKGGAGGFEAKMSARIHVGDTIRIQSGSDTGDGFSMTVLHLENSRGKVMKVQAGEICFIRAGKAPVPGSLIYRTGEAAADLTERVAKLPAGKIPLDFQVSLNRDSLSVRIDGSGLEYLTNFPALDPARNHAVSAEDLRNAFSTGSEIFSVGQLSAEVSGEWFLPSGQLKELRRAFWNWAGEQVPRDLRRKRIRCALERFEADWRKAGEQPRPEKFPDCFAAGKNHTGQSGCRARDLESAGPDDEVILPQFVPETELPDLKRRIGSLVKSGAKIFRLTSFFQFMLFDGDDFRNITLKTMFPFPVCNSQAVLVCREFGAAGVQAWIELGQEDHDQLLDHSALPLEAYVYGRPCIFLTRAALPAGPGFIRDIRGNRFELAKQTRLSALYPVEVLELPVPEGCSAFRDFRKEEVRPGEKSGFNYFRGWS